MDRGIRNAKSQVAVEFIILVGFCLAFTLVFLSGIAEQRAEISRKRDFIAVQDIAYKLQSELVIASQVNDGYNRSFFIPEEIYSNDYEIIKYNRSFSVIFKRIEYSADVPESEGFFRKGSNTIAKQGGVIYLN